MGHFYLRKTKQTKYLIICTSKVRLENVVCLTESILRRLAFTHHALLQSRYYMPYGLQVYKRVCVWPSFDFPVSSCAVWTVLRRRKIVGSSKRRRFHQSSRAKPLFFQRLHGYRPVRTFSSFTLCIWEGTGFNLHPGDVFTFGCDVGYLTLAGILVLCIYIWLLVDYLVWC